MRWGIFKSKGKKKNPASNRMLTDEELQLRSERVTDSAEGTESGPAVHKKPPRERRKRENSMRPLIRDVLSGEFLTREGVTKHIPYLLFVSLLFIVYISLGYRFERIERQKHGTDRSIEELSATYKTLRADLETQLQQSSIEAAISELGLLQTKQPPFVLVDHALSERP